MLDTSKITIDNFNYLEETTSTNDYINNLHKKGDIDEFTSCFAERQTKGRGRFNREWKTLELSIAYSFLLKLFKGQEPLVICTSIHKALNKFVNNEHLKIKWPNDIIFNNTKIAGILIEGFQKQNSRYYVVGIGINITKPQKSELDDNIGFLKDCCKDDEVTSISREQILNDIHQQVIDDIKDFRNNGFESFKEYFLDHCNNMNQEISVNTGNTTKKGIFKGISGEGHLILQEKDSIVCIPAGEILQNK